MSERKQDVSVNRERTKQRAFTARVRVPASTLRGENKFHIRGDWWDRSNRFRLKATALQSSVTRLKSKLPGWADRNLQFRRLRSPRKIEEPVSPLARFPFVGNKTDRRATLRECMHARTCISGRIYRSIDRLSNDNHCCSADGWERCVLLYRAVTRECREFSA